jgi:hypothetical protein
MSGIVGFNSASHLGAGVGWLVPSLRHRDRDIPDFVAQTEHRDSVKH